MDGYVNIFEKRMDDLVKISIKERKSKGFGVLFLDFSKENELNCFFLILEDNNFPVNIRDNIINRKEVAPTSMVYFYLYDNKEERIIEIDLDKNSNFHEKTNSKLNINN
jgi:hypothetical protein